MDTDSSASSLHSLALKRFLPSSAARPGPVVSGTPWPHGHRRVVLATLLSFAASSPSPRGSLLSYRRHAPSRASYVALLFLPYAPSRRRTCQPTAQERGTRVRDHWCESEEARVRSQLPLASGLTSFAQLPPRSRASLVPLFRRASSSHAHSHHAPASADGPS